MLFGEYSDLVAEALCFQNFDGELVALPGEYVPPRGHLLIRPAVIDEQLAAVLREKALARRQHPLGIPSDRSPALEQRAPAGPPDPVAGVVADDRRDRRHSDHRHDRVVTLRGENRGSDQCGLAGQRHTCRLCRDHREEQHKPV